jgi:hypothetical protein
MLERCVAASGRAHRLTTQYRMHPHVCAAVSRQFYDGELETDEAIASERFAVGEERGDADAMVWCQVDGAERVPDDGKSFVNDAEVVAVTAAAMSLRERHGYECTIAILTFYKGQFLALLEALPASLKVECLTVDACQGSEFDYVIISTTRGAFYTLVTIRPRWRGERRSLRTFAGVSLRPRLAFNTRPRCLSTPTDAFQLHPDVRSYGPSTLSEQNRVDRVRVRPAARERRGVESAADVRRVRGPEHDGTARPRRHGLGGDTTRV